MVCLPNDVLSYFMDRDEIFAYEVDAITTKNKLINVCIYQRYLRFEYYFSLTFSPFSKNPFIFQEVRKQ